MIPIKIECGCGQRYAFEIEPLGDRMPSAVVCPACVADGTEAANAVITQSVATQPTVAAADGLRLHVATPALSDQPTSPARPAARRGATMLPGQVERSQAEHEARGKIPWGDPPKEVIGYLMMQGFSREEASSLVEEMFQERAATIRGNGIQKIVAGAMLVCIPIVTFLIFLGIGVIYVKILAVTIIAGLWGAWMVVKGIFMVAAPKSESGDVAEE